MRYVGGKNRLSRYIAPIMLKFRKPDQCWVEPFVGGGNMICRISGKRIGGDASFAAIEALKIIRDNYDDLPRNNTEFTEAMYKKMIAGWDYKYKHFASFAYTIGGVYRGGFARCRKNVDYVRRAYIAAVKQNMYLTGVTLVYSDYQNLKFPKNSLIYCDPPYDNVSTDYRRGSTEKFNHDLFWAWCRNKHKEGHTIFISEYAAPNDFTCIYSQTDIKSLRKSVGKSNTTIERLFTL